MHALLFAAPFAALAFAAPTAPTCSTTARTTSPFSFPLPDGFPTSPNLPATYAAAHGSLPNGALPKSIASTTATILEVIATNELLEVAFFYDLVNNLTSCVEGYRVGDKGLRTNRQYDHAVRFLTQIIAVEKLHAIGANAILANAGRPTILPCKYQFPVQNYADAIAFIAAVTDVVLGTLQSAIYNFALDGDTALAPLIGSIIGNEAEQEGFFRIAQFPQGTKNPTAMPFLTAADGAFAYSAINQLVLVPGSCPNASNIAVPIFKPLSVNTASVTASTTSLSFSFTGSNSEYSLVYINQQNVPVVYALQNTQTTNGVTTFSAPFNGTTMTGLTIAAITNSQGPFTGASDVAAATVYGPGVIENVN